MSDEKTKVIINCLNAGMKVVETAEIAQVSTSTVERVKRRKGLTRVRGSNGPRQNHVVSAD